MENPPEEPKSFEDIMESACGGRGPRIGDRRCKGCENFKECRTDFLSFFTPTPNYILDSMGSDLSGSAQKVFHAINRLVDFRREKNGRENKYYNRCFATYGRLSERSGVAESNMGKYVSELVREGYIWHNQRVEKANGVYNTMNEFRVVWRIHAEKLDIFYEKRGGF